MTGLLTVADLAERWKVSKMTVYRLAHDGKLKHIKIGASFRFRPEDVEAYETEADK